MPDETPDKTPDGKTPGDTPPDKSADKPKNANAGLEAYTKGAVAIFSGGGLISMAAKTSFELVYGVKTSLFVGINNTLNIGMLNTTLMGGSSTVNLAQTYILNKFDAFASSDKGGSHNVTHSYLMAGADKIHRARINTVRKVTWILVAIQATVAAVETGAVLHQEIKKAKNEKLSEASWKAWGYAATATSTVLAITSLCAILYNKVRNCWSATDPTGALSLHDVGGTGSVFLGTRTATGSHTAGMTMNQNGIHLDAAEADLGYEKTDTAIVGLKNDGAGKDGSSLKLGHNGHVYLRGQRLDSTTSEDSRLSAKAVHVSALKNDAVVSGLSVDDKTIFAQANKKAMLAADAQSGVQGLASDKGYFQVSDSRATIGIGNSRLVMDERQITLALGNTAIKIDGAGVTIAGGKLQVLAGGSGLGKSAELTQIITRVKQWLGEANAQGAQAVAAVQVDQAADAALQQVQNVLVAVGDGDGNGGGDGGNGGNGGGSGNA